MHVYAFLHQCCCALLSELCPHVFDPVKISSVTDLPSRLNVNRFLHMHLLYILMCVCVCVCVRLCPVGMCGKQSSMKVKSAVCCEEDKET